MKCDHSTIDNILNANQVERYSKAQQINQKIIIQKNDFTLTFETSSFSSNFIASFDTNTVIANILIFTNKITKLSLNIKNSSSLNRTNFRN